MNNGAPNVSVIMAVYNAESFVAEAVRSICNQTVHQLEFIIVDDGSRGRTPQILLDLARRDQRITVIRRPHEGLAASLNCAIGKCRSDLVARQDADDVSLPYRLQRQVKFLSEHPNVAAVGCSADVIDAEGNPINGRKPTKLAEHDTRIKWGLLFRNRIVHSSVLFRRAAVEQVGRYDLSFDTSQDLDLWSRLGQKYALANMKDVLIRYRVHNEQVGNAKALRQSENSRRISRRNLHHLGLSLSDTDFNAIHRVLGAHTRASPEDHVLVSGLLPDIFDAFQKLVGKQDPHVSEIRREVETAVMCGIRHAARIAHQRPWDTLRLLRRIKAWRWCTPGHFYLLHKAVHSALQFRRRVATKPESS